MPLVLILSSHVAASPVGGGAQAATLARLGVDTALVPTVLFGRHPGLGPPGGGPVPLQVFEGMLEGVEAAGALARADAVILGYFASPDQVAAAARTLVKLRAVNPACRIVVDPIMGDHPRGLYVPETVARAIAADLVPCADLLAPNAWELARLSGESMDATLAAARAMGRPVLVSSVPVGGDIAVLYVDGRQAWRASHRRIEQAVNGAGDRLIAWFTAGLVLGSPPKVALQAAVEAVAVEIMGPTEVRLEALA